MSTGKPTFECNRCGDPVARRGLCLACTEVRRAAQVDVQRVTAAIRVECGVELPQHIELLSPLPTMPVAAPESLQKAPERPKTAPDTSGPPASARERLGLATLMVPPPPPKHTPDMSGSARVRLAAKAAEARYEQVKAWIPAGRVFTEREAAAFCGASVNTTRTTLQKLGAEGVIAPVRGKGWACAGWEEPQSPAVRAIRQLRERGAMDIADLSRAVGVGVVQLRKALHDSGKTRIEAGRVRLREGA